jgi:hypothetical protein
MLATLFTANIEYPRPPASRFTVFIIFHILILTKNHQLETGGLLAPDRRGRKILRVFQTS